MYSKYIDATLKDLKDKKYTVLYLAAFGSYNYGLQNEKSDFDMKAIVDVSELELYKNPYNHSLIKYQYGECELINIYEFSEKLRNFELPYLEVLFSKINYKHPGFDVDRLKDYVNEVLLKNRTCLGEKILHTMEKIKHNFNDTFFDYKGKKTYNIIRLYNLFVKFNSVKRYEECLFVDDDSNDDGKGNNKNGEREIMLNHKNERIEKSIAANQCEEYIFKMKMYMYYHKFVESNQLIDNIQNVALQITQLYKFRNYMDKENKKIQSKLSFSTIQAISLSSEYGGNWKWKWKERWKEMGEDNGEEKHENEGEVSISYVQYKSGSTSTSMSSPTSTLGSTSTSTSLLFFIYGFAILYIALLFTFMLHYT